VAENLPAVARALDDAKVDRVALLAVLRNLLAEEVSIRNAATVFEAVVHGWRGTREPGQLTELARHELRRQISRRLADGEQVVRVIALDPDLEEELRRSLYTSADGIRSFGLPPDRAMDFLDSLQELVRSVRSRGARPIVVVPAGMRRELFLFCQRYVPDLTVLAYPEIHESCTMKTVATLALEPLADGAVHDLPVGASVPAVDRESEDGWEV